MLSHPAVRYAPGRLLLAGICLSSGLACPSATGPLEEQGAVKLGFAIAAATTARSGIPLLPQPVIQVEDRQGNPLAEAGHAITATLVSSGGTLEGTLQLRTDLAGRAAFTDLSISALAGSWTLRFDSPGLSSATTDPIQLGAGTPVVLELFAGNLQTSVAGSPVTVAPAVRVTDRARNPASGVPVSFAAGAGGLVEGAAAITNANGVAAPTRWTLSTVIGLNSLTATSSAIPGASFSFTATGTVGPPALLTVVAGEGQSAAVGGSVAILPAVKLIDAAGHSLPGVAVSFAVGIGGGTLTAGSPLTDADGTATVGNWTLGLPAGSNTLIASRSGVASVTVHATGVGFAVQAVAAGYGHSCALDPGGTPYCWGSNALGQIGNGLAADVSVPSLVSGGLLFASIAAGNGHSCGLLSNGDAYCWGDNSAGQLGDGTLVPHFTPNPVAGGFKFQSVVTGSGFSCGVLLDGTARCWGFGSNGQLGDGTATSRSLPTLVSDGHFFQTVTAGSSHACGLDTGGALFCWGFNGSGRLGDGTTTNRTGPAAVLGGLTFSSVSAGASHTCGITTGGAGYCWGSGASGLLGDGALTDQLVPIALSGGLVLTGLSAHVTHSCALTASQLAYCWGFNASGQLGDGTLTTRLVPTLVAGGLSYTTVRAGAEHSCARATSGVLYCWGRNDTGPVGDGTLLARLKPVGVVKP